MKRAFTLLGVLAAAFTLAACGGNDGGPGSVPELSIRTSPARATSVAGQHNEQDVKFAQGMIAHHQQAIAMAELAKTRASKSAVKQLAASIESAQESEIKQMTGWLTSWGASVPGSDPEQHMGEGMMSEQDMKKLAALSGAQFDKAFLAMMIKHHQGAITMGKAEQAGGLSSEAKSLAGDIVDAQSAEIIRMKSLLKEM
jgi:uncharacterized protein (DUF305 family)